MSHRAPPKKQKGAQTGPRRIAGDLLDLATQARELGFTEKQLRARVTRGLVPYRQLGGRGGRIVFLRDEVAAFLRGLPGVTAEQALENIAGRNGQGGLGEP
jgi:hypothetical protein